MHRCIRLQYGFDLATRSPCFGRHGGLLAVFRALREQDELRYFGLFTGLDDHDDSIVYDKLDPPLTSMAG